MSTYNGISISEYRLPVIYIIYIFLAVALMVAALFLLYQILSDRDQKSLQRMNKLRANAEIDEQAATQLA